LQARYALDDIVLAGGCAYNSVANGKIVRRTKFKDCYLQSASGDAGGAIGAAFYVWHQLRPEAVRFRMDHAYWGPEFDGGAIEATLASRRKDIDHQNCRVIQFTNESELIKRTATAIAAGKVIGWFHGRMEWGPRALGNRSIIADPRRSNMKEILNLKIKRRESFRPFAPSVLRERVSEYFQMDTDSPYMLLVAPVVESRRTVLTKEQESLWGIDLLNVPKSDIPAATHVDYSARVQTVDLDINPRYYKLLKAFERKTGCGLLVNTSFNVRNEPIVCSPEDAYRCFMRTAIDILVMENCVLYKTEQEPLEGDTNWQQEFEMD